MALIYLKQAKEDKVSTSEGTNIQRTVEGILEQVKVGGDLAIRKLSEQFDSYSPASFRLSNGEIEDLVARVSSKDIADIKFAQEQIKNFAQEQRKSILDIEVETIPGVRLGHKNVPVNSVGCYVPGGKFPMVASAHMSILTAAVAGVPRIAAATPPFGGEPNPAVIAAMHMAGADEIYVMGGVQAIAALAFGTESIKAVDMLVGSGNAYVAEAKRQLFGKVGIDLLAGPTETLLVVDETVDAEICATDLLGQAEHGYDSPAV